MADLLEIGSRHKSRWENRAIIVRIRLDRVQEVHISRVAFIKTAEIGEEARSALLAAFCRGSTFVSRWQKS